MGFTFVSGLAPGSNSALLVVQTNAAFYQPTIASLIDGSVASVASLVPTAVNTPEPSSVVLLGCCRPVSCCPSAEIACVLR